MLRHIALLALFAVCGAAPAVSVSDAFDADIALYAVHLSAAAYCSNATLENWSCQPCKAISDFKPLYVFEHAPTFTRGFIGLSRTLASVVLSFEGSEDLENFITDAEAWHVDFKVPGAPSGVEVHSGFYNAYNSVATRVRSQLTSLRDSYASYRLLVTGHSLGAALASIAAIDLDMNNVWDDIYVYSFGLPRVGNFAYAQFFNSTITTKYHVTHNRDLVPHLPPESFGFHHEPREVFQVETYTGPSSLRVCDGSGEDPTCGDQYNIFAEWSVSDHLLYMGVPLGSSGCGSSFEAHSFADQQQ